jgi:hypothetical protein
MIDQRAVYREETARWYRNGEEFKTPGVVAINYPEAFEMLYGAPPVIPPQPRAQRRD